MWAARDTVTVLGALRHKKLFSNTPKAEPAQQRVQQEPAEEARGRAQVHGVRWDVLQRSSHTVGPDPLLG